MPLIMMVPYKKQVLSIENKYLAVAHDNTPSITIYKRDEDNFNKLPDPNILPVGLGLGVSFSYDSNYLAVNHMSSPYLTIYKRNGDSFNKLPNPNILPSGTGRGVSFSSDNNYLVVTHDTNPFITIYKRNGDNFNKLPNPNILPPNTGFGVSFSSNNNYLAVGHNDGSFLTIYKREGDNFNQLPNPDILLPSTGLGVSFSHDSSYLAVTHGTGSFITIYKRNGDSFNKLPNPNILPPNVGRCVSFSPDDIYLVVGHNSSPFITIYKKSGDSFNKLPNPNILPPNTGFGVSFPSDNMYLAVAHHTTPYLTIYKREGDNFNQLPNPDILPSGIGRGVSFSPILYKKEQLQIGPEIQEPLNLYQNLANPNNVTIQTNESLYTGDDDVLGGISKLDGPLDDKNFTYFIGNSTSNSINGKYYGVYFAEPTTIDRIRLIAAQFTYLNHSGVIAHFQGSNDGGTWTTILSTPPILPADEIIIFPEITFNYYRLYVENRGTSDRFRLLRLELYYGDYMYNRFDDYTSLLFRGEPKNNLDPFEKEYSRNAYIMRRRGSVHYNSGKQYYSMDLPLRFDGSSLIAADKLGYLILDGDFTIDFKIFIDEGQTNKAIFRIGKLSTTATLAVDISSTDNIRLVTSNSGSSTINIRANNFISVNSWSHCSITRSGGTIQGFKDGLPFANFVLTDALDQLFVLGARENNSTTEASKFYLEDFRISKGIARWTKRFTPPIGHYIELSESRNKVLNAIWDTARIPSNVSINNSILEIAGTSFNGVRGNDGISTGKLTWEIEWVAGPSVIMGICDDLWFDTSGHYRETNGIFAGIYSSTDAEYGELTGTTQVYSGQWETINNENIYGFVLDTDRKRLCVYKNGAYIIEYAWTKMLTGKLRPCIIPVEATIRANFGAKPFKYSYPV